MEKELRLHGAPDKGVSRRRFLRSISLGTAFFSQLFVAACNSSPEKKNADEVIKEVVLSDLVRQNTFNRDEACNFTIQKDTLLLLLNGRSFDDLKNTFNNLPAIERKNILITKITLWKSKRNPHDPEVILISYKKPVSKASPTPKPLFEIPQPTPRKDLPNIDV